MKTYPEWATDKMKEGMAEFHSLLSDYVGFEVEFRPTDHPDDVEEGEQQSRFTAEVSYNDATPIMFDIAFDYEATWDCLGERVHEWQFLFAGGDASREMTSEIFFMSMFFESQDHLKLVEKDRVNIYKTFANAINEAVNGLTLLQMQLSAIPEEGSAIALDAKHLSGEIKEILKSAVWEVVEEKR